MKCFKGNIITVNSNNDVARYLVEEQGKIVYVGDRLPQKYENAELIELEERALIPAFVDTHQHFASFSTFHAGLNVMEAKSNREILQMIKKFVEKSSSKTLIAFGASPYSVSEKRLVSRAELDSVCPDKEIMVVKYDGHACVVNSKLLKKLDNQVKNLRGYHPDSGEMNQEAFFKFSDYLSSSLSVPELFANMQRAVDYQAEKGIGCINTVSGVGYVGNLDITMEKIFAKGLKNGFQLRVFPQSLNVEVATKRKLPRIGGCFACALDGCFGSHDAAMVDSYIDENGGNGILYYSDEKVIEFCKKANRLGLQIELHAIGDAAFEQACKALKAALDELPRNDHRHGIIHACIPNEKEIKICKEYQIMLHMQSAFINWKQEPDEYLENILGYERWSKLNPIRTYMDNGIVITLGSDAPCTSPDPIMWLERAVNNSNKSEAVSMEEALRMCTYNGCLATFDEKERGSLEVGKIADMVILSENPYKISKDKIIDLKVERLYLGGRPYESCKENIAKTVIRGLCSKAKV